MNWNNAVKKKKAWAKISQKQYKSLIIPKSYRKCLLQITITKGGSTCYQIIGCTFFPHLVFECLFTFEEKTDSTLKSEAICLFIEVDEDHRTEEGGTYFYTFNVVGMYHQVKVLILITVSLGDDWRSRPRRWWRSEPAGVSSYHEKNLFVLSKQIRQVSWAVIWSHPKSSTSIAKTH